MSDLAVEVASLEISLRRRLRQYELLGEYVGHIWL